MSMHVRFDKNYYGDHTITFAYMPEGFAEKAEFKELGKILDTLSGGRKGPMEDGTGLEWKFERDYAPAAQLLTRKMLKATIDPDEYVLIDPQSEPLSHC